MLDEVNSIARERECTPRARESKVRLIVITACALVIVLVTGYALKLSETQQIKGKWENLVRAQLSVNGSIRQAIEMYKYNVGQYPKGLNDLLVAPDGVANPAAWKGPYLLDARSFTDPWDRSFQYRRVAASGPSGLKEEFKIWCLGPDGRDQTPDDIHAP